MADFMAGEPDGVSAHLADHAHRSGGVPGEGRSLTAEGWPGEEPASVAGGGGASGGGASGGGASGGGATDNRAADDHADDRLAENIAAGDDTAEDDTAEDDTAEGDTAEGGARDARLADFAQDRCGDAARPNAWHLMVLSELTGAGDRCPGATDDEALGLLGRWKAAESWAAARKLGVAREMIRRRAVPEKGTAAAGLPWEWERDLEHEVAAQLRTSLVAAGKLLHLAWSLEARLPRIGEALSEGRLDPGQAKMIITETDALPDDKATVAEELILAGLEDCHTWAELLRLVQRAVVTVDPDGARRRREQAERETARVRLWRESSGACALAGHALPTDQALAAWGHVEARAQHYRAHGIKEYIDLLRVMAYLDLLNGVPAHDRIAQWTADATAKAATATADPAKPGTATPTPHDGGAAPAPEPARPAPGRRPPEPRGTGNPSSTPDAGKRGYPQGDSHPGAGDSTDGPGSSSPGGRSPGNGSPPSGTPDPGHSDLHGDNCPGAGGCASDPCDNRPADWFPADGFPADAHSGDTDPGNTSPGSDLPAATGSGPELRARVNLTIPMGTATGHHDRPGEAWELGVLDPDLARQLLAAAARSPGSEFCVTVTDEHGYAVGHGCAKPAKPAKSGLTRQPTGTTAPGPAPPENRATFTRRDGRWHSVGPPGGFGTWTLTLPGTGTTLTVDLKPVPTHACDHAYESAGHDPSQWLRHVVQIRDGKCSFPSCGRHARESDFEHATPHQEGGKTCACNCHACSRSCHQVKQRPGWTVTSPTPGWHQWTTPAGRTYSQGPWQYPA